MLRKIKDRCDKNRGCQEITKQRYERNQDRREKIEDTVVIKINVFKKKLNKVMTKIEVVKKKKVKGVMTKIKVA